MNKRPVYKGPAGGIDGFAMQLFMIWFGNSVLTHSYHILLYILRLTYVRPSVNNCFKSLLLLQFSINLNQTWQKVRTHGGAKNVGSGILNFCLWVEKSRRLCQFLSIYSNRYSSYVSQPILTKLGTKLEPIGRQKMLGAEF